MIRKVTPSGVVTTVVGGPVGAGLVLGPLPASLNRPIGVAVYGNTLYISDTNESVILQCHLP